MTCKEMPIEVKVIIRLKNQNKPLVVLCDTANFGIDLIPSKLG